MLSPQASRLGQNLAGLVPMENGPAGGYSRASARALKTVASDLR